MHLNHQTIAENIEKVEHVIFGPWVGEFGWELFGCQGYLRKLKEDYTHLKSFHIISRTGRSFLYEDFCDSYIEFDCPGHNVTGALCMDWKYNNFHVEIAEALKLDNYMWIPTQKFLVDYHANGVGREERLEKFHSLQKFIQYRSDKIKNSSYDILIHARNSDHHNTGEKNWALSNWNYVCKNLSERYKIACIGSKTGSLKPEYCDDLRDIDLEETVSYLNQCKTLITSCSGPAHLASLSNAPLVVLTNEANIHRYKTDWNPFNSPREIIYEKGYKPLKEYVYDRIVGFLS